MYRASLISFDKDIIKSVNSVIYNFVWKGKDKIKRISEYEDGCLKMPHIDSLIATQRIGCVKRYLDESAAPWRVFLSHYIKNAGFEFLLKCNFKLSCLPCKIPIYYKDCLETWSDSKGTHPLQNRKF